MTARETTSLKFTIVDENPEWVFCPVCKTEREVVSLEDGACPFCNTFIDEAAHVIDPRAPEPVPETTAQSASIPVIPDVPVFTELDKPVTEDEQAAFRIPYERPQATVDAVAQRELASRTLCRRRLMPFIRKFRPKYLPGWVHEDICRRLERFVADVEAGKEPRVLLMMPPRGGKSEIGSRHFPAWVLGKHPEWEVIAASHTSSLTMSFSRYVRDLIRDPAYTAIFPQTRLDPASQSVENWNIVGGGGYLAAGVGTGITGRGAHILLLDDLVKDIEAADSQTIRDNTWEWYASTAYTRLAPGGGVIGIMTWWHDDDWAGRIQQVMNSGDGDKFEVIRYPAINDQGDEYILADDTIVQILPGFTVPEGARLTREHNTALHPARYTTDAMLRIKRNLIAAGQQRVWNALYQQNPLPDDGILFTKDMFRFYPQLPPREKCYVYQAWDFAITEGSEKDYTVGVTVYQDEFDNLYVADVRRFRSGDSFVIADEIISYALEYDALVVGVEDGQIWKAMDAVFQRRCDERRAYITTEVLKPLTDKIVRASPLRGRMQLGKVYFDQRASWYQELFLELTRFPNVKHDDQVDALAWAVRLTLAHSAPRVVVAEPRLKSWKDKLPGLGRGQTTHMAS